MLSNFKYMLVLALMPLISLAFDENSKTNVAVYWGQNSAGSQVTLGEYCQNSEADIFLLSFLYEFPTLGLNFANACSDTFGDGLLHCSQIAQDIKTCQSLGKKVLLSLGGASGAYGFTSDAEAETFAQTLWNTFGEGSSDVEHPFDDALVDGFDFDIENNISTGYVALVNKLRTLFDGSSKKYYISAAPQCPYPDASVGDLLENAQVDFSFIQFYNNYCSVQGQFNWDTWVTYATTISPNSNIKLFVGLPASATAAGSGYISDLTTLASVIQGISTSANFGGISLWDASQAFSNQIDGKDYIANMKDILNNNVNSGSSSVTTSTSSSSTVTTSTAVTVKSSSIPPAISFTSQSQAPVVTSASASSTSIPVRSSSIPPAISFTSHSHNVLSTSSEVTVIQSTATIQQNSQTPTYTATSVSDRITTTLSPASTTNAPVEKNPDGNNSPVTTTLSPAVTTSANVQTSATSSVPAETSTDAHVRAQQLNAQYNAGQLNGKSTCDDGEIVCSGSGQFAICNFGAWVYMDCAAGTTCYAYDSNNEVFTGCNFTSLKSTFQ